MNDVDTYYAELDRLKYVSKPCFSMLSEAALRGKAIVDAESKASWSSLSEEERAKRRKDIFDTEFYTIVVRSPDGRRVVIGPGTGA